MRQLSLALALVGSLVMTACAAGVSDGPPGSHPDARINTGPDANFNGTPDANFNAPDAFVTPTPDAFVPIPDAPVSGGSCTDSAECAAVDPTTCCFQNACVLGIDFGPPLGCLPLN